MSGFSINPSTLLQAQNAYNTTSSQKATLPEPSVDIKAAESFHNMVNKNFNSFAKMNPQEIMNFAKQVQSVQSTSINAGASSSIISKAFESIPKALRKDEEVKKRAIINEASLSEVIASTSEAKAVLQTAVAVRNKLLDAFDKIMNMPV